MGSMGEGLRRDILECVGGTSIVALRKIVPATGARILLKVESENPTGSMKDRMALAMIEVFTGDDERFAFGEAAGGNVGDER